MVAIRAWVVFACPVFARIGAYVLCSALLTMISFMSSAVRERRTLFSMGKRYFSLLAAKAVRERSICLTLALLFGACVSVELARAAVVIMLGRAPI